MPIIHFQRRPAPGQVSIERVFAEVRRAMPAELDCSLHVCPRLSRGLLGRVENLRDARKAAGDINHVTGDVHYLALGLAGQRTLLTIHDCVSLERLGGWKRALVRWLWYVLPARRAGLVSVVSESARQEVLRHAGCDPGKVRVVHNCICAGFKPAPKVFDRTDPCVLQVGTGPNKNLKRVVEALVGLRCRLKVIGRLGANQVDWLNGHGLRYSNLCDASDAEVLDAYRESDLVLFASTYEGFGLPIIEANAIGRPVVTSNLLSMPEVAGKAAWLVDPLDVRAIREGVQRVISDVGLRRCLVAAGFENVKRFAPKAIAAQYASLYQELQLRPLAQDEKVASTVPERVLNL